MVLIKLSSRRLSDGLASYQPAEPMTLTRRVRCASKATLTCYRRLTHNRVRPRAVGTARTETRTCSMPSAASATRAWKAGLPAAPSAVVLAPASCLPS